MSSLLEIFMPRKPQAAEMPVSPSTSVDAERQRQNAAQAAQVASIRGGRPSTIHAGAKIAMGQQAERVARRSASSSLGL
jgi:hypothetical protein